MQRVRRLNKVDRSRIFMELHRATTPCLASIARPCACSRPYCCLKHTSGCEDCHTDRQHLPHLCKLQHWPQAAMNVAELGAAAQHRLLLHRPMIAARCGAQHVSAAQELKR